MIFSVQMEIAQFQGWMPWNLEYRITASEIMKQAKDRLGSGSSAEWNKVRPALSVTVRYGSPILKRSSSYRVSGRGLIIHAFIQEKVNGNPKLGLQFFDTAVEILETGRKWWPSVVLEDRGAIFLDTFLRGVRSMRLSALHPVC
jgi:hypothetical protein